MSAITLSSFLGDRLQLPNIVFLNRGGTSAQAGKWAPHGRIVVRYDRRLTATAARIWFQLSSVAVLSCGAASAVRVSTGSMSGWSAPGAITTASALLFILAISGSTNERGQLRFVGSRTGSLWSRAPRSVVPAIEVAWPSGRRQRLETSEPTRV